MASGGIRTVIGSGVRDAGGARIGAIADLLVDKASHSLFAVVAVENAFQRSYRPVLWSALRYDDVNDGYVVMNAEGSVPEFTDQIERRLGLGAPARAMEAADFLDDDVP
ncbi:MAG: hypothetical protein JO361_01570, partial [Gammaproteobacteria bacterium]|nr:hypothetical protein [Gammaproteobacteria bacterium]